MAWLDRERALQNEAHLSLRHVAWHALVVLGVSERVRSAPPESAPDHSPSSSGVAVRHSASVVLRKL